MKKYRWLSALLVLVFASLACQTVMGGRPTSAPTQVFAPAENTNDNSNFNSNSNANTNGSSTEGSGTSTAGFPLPPDATSVTDMGPTLVTFQTKMSIDDVMKFYRDELDKAGYTERKELTVTTADTFSMVFDGDPSGKALAIQGVHFGGSVTVTLSLQDI